MPFKLLTKYPSLPVALTMLPTALQTMMLAVAVMVLLAACAGPSPQQQPAYTTKPGLTELAERSLRAAEADNGPGKAQHLLDAAQIYHQLKLNSSAEKTLAEIDSAQLSARSLGQYTVLYAPVLLSKHEHFRAREYLTAPKLLTALPTLAKPLQITLRETRGDLFSLLGEDSAAVAEYVALSRLLSDTTAIKISHDKIWQILSHTPDNTLFNQAADARGMALKGWYQLALATRSLSDLSLQQGQIERWRKQWPAHPAVYFPPSNLGAIAAAAEFLPTQVALLLPLNGRYGEAGTVIRDGFLANYYDNLAKGARVPTIRIYDTSEQAIADAYRHAVSEGADFVIGPLRKENLAALTRLDTLPIPLVGLNYLDQKLDNRLNEKLVEEDHPATYAGAISHANFYQFGLSISDEAAQVAKRAWLEGHRSAMVITPSTAWGERARTAFSEHWVNRGGIIVSTRPYALSQSDFTEIIKPALLIDQSNQRAKKIQRTLGKNLEFSPRRRHDIDMIFLVAQPGQARSIKPTLDFFYAHDLPVYATSHLYTGIESAEMIRDLNGVRFSAMSWTLPGLVAGDLIPDSNMRSAYRHLYALGIDAYQLHQNIALMQASPQTQIYGRTGTLSLSSGNIVKRILPWAEFKNSGVRPITVIQEY